MQKPEITIEYCPKCGWLLRSAYLAQELLTTFEEELVKVSLVPSEIGGNFEIKLNENVIFNRKTAGRFPEVKELKTLVRDLIAPERNLGHIDRANQR
ncbi:MAG: SelT/SelW/SelH family protein [Cytophagales bacterium]